MLMDYRDEEKLLRDSVASFAERVLRERVRPFRRETCVSDGSGARIWRARLHGHCL